MKIYENGQLRDLTPKELEDIKAFEDEQKKIPNKPTLEEQILALQNALITSKISGGGITTITDSSENRIKEFSLIGKSEQVTTTGKNLFDIVSARNNDNYKPILGKPYELTAMEYDLVPNTDYVLSISRKISNPKSNLFIANDTGRKSLAINDVFYQTVNSLESGIIYVGFSGISHDTGIPDFESEYFDVQLEVGTSRTPYEPYTGGKPSPSPDYPQEIKNVGKWNEEKQKYEVDVRVIGKNLFDSRYASNPFNWVDSGDGFKTLNKPLITNGEEYTISSIKLLPKGLGFNFLISESFERLSVKHYYFYHNGNSPVIKDRVTVRESDNLYLKMTGDFDSFASNLLNILQFEKGGNKTAYEPYKEQTLTLTSERPITKWDKLVEQDGQIGWLYKSQIIDRLDGKSNKVSLGGKKGEVQHFSIEFKNTPKGNGNTDIYVDKYRAVPSSYALEEFGICCNWNDGIKYFSAPNINITNTEEFKAWLSENPLTLEYETETPEFVPLPQSEQDAIRALKTYYPTTVITVNGGEVDPDIEVTYIADTKNYIDQKIAAIGKTVVETQKALL